MESHHDLTIEYTKRSKIEPLTIRIFASSHEQAIESARTKWENFPPTKVFGVLKVVSGDEPLPICRIEKDYRGMTKVIEII